MVIITQIRYARNRTQLAYEPGADHRLRTRSSFVFAAPDEGLVRLRPITSHYRGRATRSIRLCRQWCHLLHASNWRSTDRLLLVPRWFAGVRRHCLDANEFLPDGYESAARRQRFAVLCRCLQPVRQHAEHERILIRCRRAADYAAASRRDGAAERRFYLQRRRQPRTADLSMVVHGTSIAKWAACLWRKFAESRDRERAIE